jgi:triacylglycerol lipase
MATYPIVLAHGICRFDVLLAKSPMHDNGEEDCRHYYRLVRSTLRRDGHTVYHANVPWAEGVSRRASALRADVELALRETGAPKVHIIAHSMGGLDARHLLFEHQDARMHEKVASLTTIGTPHHGTAFADFGVANADGLLFLLRLLEIKSIDGFVDLTRDVCAAFNGRSADFEHGCGVFFQTIAGAQTLPYVFEPLRVSWGMIHLAEGANDGLVSVESAKWRDEYFRGPVWNADHLNQLGWWEPNDLGPALLPPLGPRGETWSQLEARILGEYRRIAHELDERFPL